MHNFKEFRIKIMEDSIKIHNKEFREFELDESYFGPKRVRGKRGRGAAGKTPVFAILQRDGKDFVSVFSNGSKDSLMPIIQGKILDRVFHSKDEFARGKRHINGIDGNSFVLPLKESEFRFNHRNKNLLYVLDKICR